MKILVEDGQAEEEFGIFKIGEKLVGVGDIELSVGKVLKQLSVWEDANEICIDSKATSPDQNNIASFL